MEKAGECEDPPPLQRRALLVTSCPTQKLAGPPHTEITLGVPTGGEGQEAHSGLAPALSSQCTFPHSLILGCEGFQERDLRCELGVGTNNFVFTGKCGPELTRDSPVSPLRLCPPGQPDLYIEGIFN